MLEECRAHDRGGAEVIFIFILKNILKASMKALLRLMKALLRLSRAFLVHIRLLF